MKKISFFPQISLLNYYLISELIRPLLFSIIIVTVVAESIGISFEQFKFLINKQLSFPVLIYLHFLKLPEFIVLALPIATLMATIFTYQKLSSNSEIVALQSCGVSLYRLTYPAIITGLLVTFIQFTFNDIFVPPANYQAAITLESSLNINRSNLKNSDILYKEFYQDYVGEQNQRSLKYLFYADKFIDGKLQSVTLLIRDAQRLKIIITSSFAQCYEQQEYCYFYHGSHSLINADGSYGQRVMFDTMPLYLPHISSQFQADREKLDDREMNLYQAYQRLSVLETAGDRRDFLNLKFHIYKRFSSAVSCTVFAFLGGAIGINLQPRVRYNSFALTLGIILVYDAVQIISGILIISDVVSFYCLWLPNILAVMIGVNLLIKKTTP